MFPSDFSICPGRARLARQQSASSGQGAGFPSSLELPGDGIGLGVLGVGDKGKEMSQKAKPRMSRL